MANKILKKLLGEAGAGLDSSSGNDNLRDVLVVLANRGPTLSAYLGTIATGILTSYVAKGGEVLSQLSASVAVCGTASTTTVQLRVNGTAKATLSFANTDTDPTTSSDAVDPEIVLAEGDIVDLNVSAAATNATGLSATAHFRPGITIE